ncbi:Ataxin-7, partial [Ophiophagus hannah]
MATVGERRSLPSPEAMLGQPWSHWVDAAKLHGNDGAALEENFKEYGKNREAMRLCREGSSLKWVDVFTIKIDKQNTTATAV